MLRLSPSYVVSVSLTSSMLYMQRPAQLCECIDFRIQAHTFVVNTNWIFYSFLKEKRKKKTPKCQLFFPWVIVWPIYYWPMTLPRMNIVPDWLNWWEEWINLKYLSLESSSESSASFQFVSRFSKLVLIKSSLVVLTMDSGSIVAAGCWVFSWAETWFWAAWLKVWPAICWSMRFSVSCVICSRERSKTSWMYQEKN